MEEEIIQAEWQNWLMSEAQKCDYVMDNVVGQIDEVDNYQEGVDNIISIVMNAKDPSKFGLAFMCIMESIYQRILLHWQANCSCGTNPPNK